MNILTFDDFINLPMSNSKAYILGLLLPKIVISRSNENNKHYVTGQINHGYQNKPEDSDIMAHYISLNKFFLNEKINIEILFNNQLKSFSQNTLRFISLRGIGFAVCFPIDNSKIINFSSANINNNLYNNIRKTLISQVNKITQKHAPYFLAATIDGRSSVDTTLKCVSLDIDTDNNLNTSLRYITEDLLNMDINLNDRTGRSDSTRMNQLRYKEDSVKDFFRLHSNIIFSKFRRNKIEEIIIR